MNRAHPALSPATGSNSIPAPSCHTTGAQGPVGWREVSRCSRTLKHNRMKTTSVVIAICLTRTLCLAASFTGLPDISKPYGVSGNGVVVGENSSAGVRWDSAGYLDLGYVDSPGYGTNHSTSPNGVSLDGSVVVGGSGTYSSNGFTSRGQAFVWTAATGIQALGDTSYRDSSAVAVSSDGRVIVGSIHPLPGTFSGQYAAVWTDGVETLRLDVGTSAWGVSPNGLWVTGIDASAPNLDAFLWSAATGFERIGSLGPNANVGKDVSDDGTVVVGQGSNYTPFRWTRAVGWSHSDCSKQAIADTPKQPVRMVPLLLVPLATPEPSSGRRQAICSDCRTF